MNHKVSPIVYTCRSIRDKIGMSDKFYLDMIGFMFEKGGDEELNHEERMSWYKYLNSIHQVFIHDEIARQIAEHPVVTDEEALDILGL